MKRMNKLAVGILLLSQAISGAAFAATVTLAGTTVSFTFDSALSGLFGAPTVTGDALYFTPTTYKAQSFNGRGSLRPARPSTSRSMPIRAIWCRLST